jgi:hypothetical protein
MCLNSNVHRQIYIKYGAYFVILEEFGVPSNECQRERRPLLLNILTFWDVINIVFKDKTITCKEENYELSYFRSLQFQQGFVTCIKSGITVFEGFYVHYHAIQVLQLSLILFLY